MEPIPASVALGGIAAGSRGLLAEACLSGFQNLHAPGGGGGVHPRLCQRDLLTRGETRIRLLNGRYTRAVKRLFVAASGSQCTRVDEGSGWPGPCSQPLR